MVNDGESWWHIMVSQGLIIMVISIHDDSMVNNNDSWYYNDWYVPIIVIHVIPKLHGSTSQQRLIWPFMGCSPPQIGYSNPTTRVGSNICPVGLPPDPCQYCKCQIYSNPCQAQRFWKLYQHACLLNWNYWFSLYLLFGFRIGHHPVGDGWGIGIHQILRFFFGTENCSSLLVDHCH